MALLLESHAPTWQGRATLQVALKQQYCNVMCTHFVGTPLYLQGISKGVEHMRLLTVGKQDEFEKKTLHLSIYIRTVF